MGVCIAPLPSPTLLIRGGSHTAARIQPSPSGSTNGPSNGLKVLLVKELWLVTRRGEEKREERRGEEMENQKKRRGFRQPNEGIFHTSEVVGVRSVCEASNL